MKMAISKFESLPGRLQADIDDGLDQLGSLLTECIYSPKMCDEIVHVLSEGLRESEKSEPAYFGFNVFVVKTDGDTVWIENDFASPPAREELAYADFKKIVAAWRQALIDGKSGYTIKI